MKQPIPIFLLCLSLLSGCAPAPEQTPAPASETPPAESASVCAVDTDAPSLAQDEVPDWVSCRIVDGAEEGELLLAELDHELNPHELSRHDGKSVYRLSLNGIRCEETAQPDGTVLAAALSNNGVSVYLDGQPAQPSDLRDGMNVEISFNGLVAECFPARLGEVWELRAYSIGTPQCPGGGYFDLCGLYLQVLCDLWQTDPGLNSDVSLAGLDLSQAPGELLESEKSALALRFGELHGVEVVEGTFEELAQEGYFSEVSSDPERPLYQWEDGCLFSISPSHDHDDEVYSGLPVLFFDAQKWCSPLGAYYFEDCSAVWPESGTWSGYKVGAEAIS